MTPDAAAPAAFTIGVVTCVARAWPALLADETGLVARALRSGVARVSVLDLRDYGRGKHRTIDDAPFGGGAGMVLAAPPLLAAIAEARARASGPVIMLAPRGRRFAQADAEALACGQGFTLVCGRYEGIDERAYAAADDCLSMGDFVLSGGDPAAWCIIDAVVRLREGTLGNPGSLHGESFAARRLQHPVYTRPADIDGARVPQVLLDGDHDKVARWRQAEGLRLTRAHRPDLLP